VRSSEKPSLTLITLITYSALLLGAGTASAEQGGTCHATVQIPRTWARSSQQGVPLFVTPDRSASLRVECSVIPKPLTDREFAAYIGEEEPDEAPPLKNFGPFRGREWIVQGFTKLEWWLTKDRYVVHFILSGHRQPLSESLEAEINALITTLQVREP